MLSFSSVTKLTSSAKLALNFQKEGPCLCLSILLKWRTIAKWSELIDECPVFQYPLDRHHLLSSNVIFSELVDFFGLQVKR